MDGVPRPPARALGHCGGREHGAGGGANQMNTRLEVVVNQMNTGLEVVDKHYLDGVFYFADDEGLYSPHLFDRLRKIRIFVTSPVPVISEGGNGVVLEVVENHRLDGVI